MMSLLKVKNLNISFKLYRGISEVVKNINMKVDVGESVAIVGETGCGKSICVKAVLGILPSPPAQINCDMINYKGTNIFGMDYRDLGKIRGSGISIVFQNPMTALSPVFTIGEQMIDIYKWHSKPTISILDWWIKDKIDKNSTKEAIEKVINTLSLVKMPEPKDILTKYSFQLSGGMRQRVQIAAALITDPDLIIFDEPTTALDLSIQNQIIDLIKEIIKKRNLSTLFITHNLGVARALCRRIYVMYAGEIVETGYGKDVFDNPLHPYTKGLLASIPKLTGKMGDGIEGKIPDYINRPSGCGFHPRCVYAKEICKHRPSELIEVEPEHYISCHMLTKKGDQL